MFSLKNSNKKHQCSFISKNHTPYKIFDGISVKNRWVLILLLGFWLHQGFGAIDINTEDGCVNHFLYPLGHNMVIPAHFANVPELNTMSSTSLASLMGPEICDNGIDDDGDGLTDGLDPDCPCADDPGGVFICTPDCGVDVPHDISNFSIKESFCIPGVYGFSPVVVGDAEGDGIPDIWVNTGQSNSTDILVFDGKLQSTTPKYTISKVSAKTHAGNAVPLAIADIDNDGDMEVAFQKSGNEIEMRSHDNTFLWSTELPQATTTFIAPAFADFNHDGIPEIYVGNTIMNARTGTILASGVTENFRNHSAIFEYVTNSIAADVKPGGNGNLELIVGHTVYDVTINNINGSSGNTIVPNVVKTRNSNQNMRDGSSYVADMDKDGLIDVVTATGNLLTVWNPRTLELMSVSVTNSANQSVLLIADFDDDGFPEISFLADKEYFVAYDYDGVALTQKWGLDVADVSSGSTGSSLFDFNGDGIQEILYRDEYSLRVLRGSDGATIARLPCPSGTQIEYPVIADIDNDGAAEIVLSCGTGLTGTNGFLKVFESDLSVPGAFEWRDARSIWNQWEYRAVNINDDGTVPLTEIYSAYDNGSGDSDSQPFNLSNAQIPVNLTPNGLNLTPAPDAQITTIDFDRSACPIIGITYTVENLGSAPLPATTTISIYDGDPTATTSPPNLLGIFTLGTTVEEGTAQTLNNAIDLGTPLHVPNAHIVINDNGANLPLPSDYNNLGENSAIYECDYTNNTILGSFSCCSSTTATVASNVKNICPSATADLTANASSPSGTLRYYEDAALTTEVVDPTAVSVSKAYYVTNTEPNCGESAAAPITVQLYTCSDADIEFTNTNVTVTEGTDTYARFTVILTDVITDDVTVDYKTNEGTALNGSDFIPKMGTITFTSSINAVNIDIPIIDDNTIEPEESFTLELSNIQSNIGVGFANNQPLSSATGTINDDDLNPGAGVRFVDDNITVDEGAGTATIQVTNVGMFATNFRVSWATRDNNPPEAMDGSDYTGAFGFFDFSGADGEVFDIVVNITDDLIIEDLERFEVILSVDIPSVVPITDNTGTITIMDNDTPRLGEGLYATGFTVAENTPSTANFVITYNGPEVQGAFNVDFDIMDGSAVDGADYTVLTALPITFSAGTQNGDFVNVAIAINDDTIFEGSEDLSIALNMVSNPIIPIIGANAIGIITDDDSIGVTLDLSAVDNSEGNDIVFTATLSTVNNTSSAITVNFVDLLTGSATSGTDYNAVPPGSTIVIPDGSNSGTISIPTVVDGLFEGDETIVGQITNVSNGAITIGMDTATATIDDNDDESGINIELYAIHSSEGDDIIFTAMLSTTNNTGSGITVDFDDLLTGSATSGTDYTAVPAGSTITIADGSYTGTINIPTRVDTLFEGDETIVAQITNVSNGAVTIGIDNATAIIDDIDDDSGITLDLSATDNIEGNDIVFIATLSTTNNTGSDIIVDFVDLLTGTATSGTDYTTVPSGSTITIANGSNTGTINIPTAVDGLFEGDETIVAQITNVSNGAVTIGIDTATVIIDDIDDDSGITLDLSATDASEGNDIVFTATLSTVNNTGSAITVDFADLLTGTATSGTDYTNVPTGSTIIIANGSNFGTITIPTNGDTIIESDETIVAQITNVSNGSVTIQTDTATAEIIDNDGGQSFGIQFDTNDIIVNEGDGTVSINVILNRNVQDPFTVAFYTIDRTAIDGYDYTGVFQNTQTLDFGGTNANTQTIVLPIIDDIRIEDTENFNVILENISTTLVSILANDTANINIIDNDGNEEWPEDITIEACEPIPASESITSNGNCAIIANLVETIAGGADDCPTEYTITRTWTITDCVGNVREHVQVITIEDTIAPVFVETLPQNMTVTCDNIPEAATLTATDSCDTDVTVTFNETVSNNANCTQGYTITRTWVATDCADNGMDHVQIITIEPTGPITVGSDDGEITIVCGEEVPEVPELTIMGGCGNYNIDFNETTDFPEGTDDYTIIRTWNITDPCGNKASFRQTIFVEQPKLEEVFLDICIEDEPIDLLSYLPEDFEYGGTFEVERPGTYLNDTVFDPADLEIGEYKISYASTNGTCRYKADFYVTVNTDCVPCSNLNSITVSETVTINGDGINDFFEIKGVVYCDLTFDVMIFNRWGDKVFEQNDYQNDWGGFAPDGSFGNSGLLPAGTYYYIINIKGAEMEPINGYIYLGTE